MYKETTVSNDALCLSRSYQDHFLQEAQKLKHSADVESELTTQALLYLEGISYFLLTGQAMESVSSPVSLGAVYRMYKETLSLIKWVSSFFCQFISFVNYLNDNLFLQIHHKQIQSAYG